MVALSNSLVYKRNLLKRDVQLGINKHLDISLFLNPIQKELIRDQNPNVSHKQCHF
jgi:hypothetical protein